jgi:SAM-dependent methyltransferase
MTKSVNGDALAPELTAARSPADSFQSRHVVPRRNSYVPASPQEEFIVPLLRAQIEHALQDCLPAQGGMRKVLDVGCGRQPFRPLVESLGGAYTSLDTEQNPEGTVEFLGAIDDTLPAALRPCGPFDLLLCTEVLEHVADWRMAFENIAALLARDGRAILTCPHFYPLHEEPFDFWRPTPHAIAWFADRVGLRVVRLDRAGDAWDVLGTLLATSQPFPRSRRLMSRVLNLGVRVGGRILFHLLRKRVLQASVGWYSPIYMANVAILAKS